MNILLEDRKIDTLGRVTIPVQIQQKLNIFKNDRVDIYEDNGNIVIKKRNNSCVFCGSTEGLTEYCKKHICANCLDTIKK